MSFAALPAATLRQAKMTLHFALASALTVSTPMPAAARHDGDLAREVEDRGDDAGGWNDSLAQCAGCVDDEASWAPRSQANITARRPDRMWKTGQWLHWWRRPLALKTFRTRKR